LPADPRGFPRPLDDPSISNADGGDGADIGAFELGLPLPSACAGDCDGNGEVDITELILAVTIALGNQDVSLCAAADTGHDGSVTIDEIIAAVHNALTACPL